MTDEQPSAGIGALATTMLEEEDRRLRARAETVVEPGKLPGVGSSELTLRQGLRLGGPSIFVVLTLINSFDELESAALAVLAPDIARTFGVSNGAIVFLTAAAGAFIVLGAVPMGWLADRVRRGPIVGVSSIVFTAMLVLSGLAGNIFTFFLTRLGGGVAKANTGPVHGSMLADAYPLGVRGRLAAAGGIAGRIMATISPLLVGAIAAIAGGVEGWRWVYLLVGLPVLVLAWLAFALPEPTRGRWEIEDVVGGVAAPDSSVSAVVTDEPVAMPISVEAGFARLRSIRTLRSVILALSAMGFGLVTLPVLANLFIEERFGLGAFERGWVATIPAVVSLVTIPFVGRAYDRMFRTDPARVLRLLGRLTIPAAFLTPVQLFAPNIVVFALLSIPQAVLLTSAFPMVFALLQAVVPYRMRGLGAAMGSVFMFFVGATGGALASLPLTNAYGPRTTILVLLVPSTILGGILLLRGAGSVVGDLRLVSDELIEERADGDRRRADPLGVPVLQLHGVDVSYGNVQVLFDVAIEVRRGEVLALLGTNGAGKSTILRVATGLMTPSVGVVRLNGSNITYVSPEQRARLGIVSIAGGDGVFPSMSVEANMRMAAFIHRGEDVDGSSGVAARVERSLRRFPALVERRSQRAGSLSGGQQQMLAMAMALTRDPTVLIIDELSLGLAPVVVGELLDVVAQLRSEGMAMLIVEQSLNVALSLADRAIFLEKGQVRFEGPAAELAERDDLVRAVFLGTEGG